MAENQKLIHRLNRTIGQIEAIRKRLVMGDEDCMEIMRLLKASASSLKKFGEVYITEYMEECLQRKDNSKDFQKKIKVAISSAFNL